MSLSGILANAGAALSVAQTQVALGTTNTANASTDGYTTKTYTAAVQTTTLALNEGEVQRVVDTHLQSSVISSASDAGYDAVVAESLNQYDSLLGSVDGGDDLSTLTSDLVSALTDLASGSGSTESSEVVAAATELADGLRTLSSGIQDLRSEADSAIATTVDTVNDLLTRIGSLNDQITSGRGADVTSLEDERDAALTSLSSLIDVSRYTDASGRMHVFTTGGQSLVGQTVSQLSFTASTVSADAAYPTELSGVRLNGKDITNQIKGGELGGQLALRDEILPAEQEALDSFAATLIDAVNSATAQASPYPPGQLESGLETSLSDGLSLTGSLTVVQMDSSGIVTSSTAVDLSSVTQVSDLVDALNAVSGVTASVSNGRLTISSASGGVALDAQSALTASGDTLNEYFGFNDVFAGDDAATIRVSSRLSDNADRLARSSLDASAGVGSRAVSSGGTGGIEAMLSALDKDRDFAAAGSVTARRTSLSSYASVILSSASSLISDAATATERSSDLHEGYKNSLNNATGVNLDEQSALVSLYQQQYEASAQLMSAVQEMFDMLISMVNS